MKMKQCDRCKTIEAESTAYGHWETVTVSTAFNYDLCEQCGKALFTFLEPKDSIEGKREVNT